MYEVMIVAGIDAIPHYLLTNFGCVGTDFRISGNILA